MKDERRPAKNAVATNSAASDVSSGSGLNLAELDQLIDVRERLVAAIDELEAGEDGMDACRALLEGLLADFDLEVAEGTSR